MTAEVGVMNRSGVALAADSAVTVGYEANKIYTSADKLFHLAGHAPVGVMIYGSADFAGLPWETIIKTYRSENGKRKYATLEEYGTQFLSFLRTSRRLFPRQRQDSSARSLVLGFMVFLREQIRERLDKEAEKKNGLDEKDVRRIVADEIRRHLEYARRHDVLVDIDKRTRDGLARRYGGMIQRVRKDLFDKLPLSSAASRNLSTLIREVLCRNWFGPFKSGLVIAGFGEDEFMPSLINYELDGMVSGRPRCQKAIHQQIDDQTHASVVPFAQRDMVQSFMEGIQLELSQHMMETTRKLFEGTIDSIVSTVENLDASIGKKLRGVLGAGVATLLNNLFSDWTTRRREYWEPVLEIASSLPKDELAAMAEALVNLTKFRRRVTNVRETVGGPIDVAVITKGDGFVWISRKHYFSAELNPRVIARYQREGGLDEG